MNSENGLNAFPLNLKAQDVMRFLNISRPTVYVLFHTPGFPVLRIGRALRVPREGFRKWLEAQEIGRAM